MKRHFCLFKFMKILAYLLCGLFLFASNVENLLAQEREITFILFRHAERYPSTKANNSNPELTPEGIKRAARLPELLKKYKPEQIFSTNLKRTVATVTPLAETIDPKYRIQIQKYDTEDLSAFADKLLKLNARTVVVAGHNNTTPELANLLIKQEKYKQFGEAEYDKMIIVKIKKGKAKDEIITY